MAESFYTDADLVGDGEFLDGSTLSLSTRMTFAVAGTITAVRWHFPAVAPSGSVGVRVYADAGGAALASGSFASPTLDAWNTVPVSVAVSAGQSLRPTIVTPGRYVARASFYASSITRGNITGINGYFTTGDGFPSGASGNQSTYFVDVVFEPSAGGQSVAPAGVSVPVVLGGPTVVWAAAVAPDGVSVPVAVGAPVVGAEALSPDGIGVPVAVGVPTLVWSATAAPAGVAVPVGAGSPATTVPGAKVHRPSTGVVERPESGIVVRPDIGVVERP